MTMPNGMEALVYFEIIERNGHLIAKAIYAEAIKVYALAAGIISQTILPVKRFFSTFVFNYFKDFSFIVSQPTRAPSL